MDPLLADHTLALPQTGLARHKNLGLLACIGRPGIAAFPRIIAAWRVVLFDSSDAAAG